MLIKVIVQTSFHISTQIVFLRRILLITAVVHTVMTPIASVGQTARHESTHSILIIFQLRKTAFIHYKSVIVATNHITYAQFLIYPGRISTIHTIRSQNVLTVIRVYIVFSTEKVSNHILVQSLIITIINTTIKIKIITKLSSIGRNQTCPKVIIGSFIHNHQRTVIIRHSTHRHRIFIIISIEFVYCIIIKCTVRTTELSVHRTIGSCTIPRTTVARHTRTTIACTRTYRHISGRTKT